MSEQTQYDDTIHNLGGAISLIRGKAGLLRRRVERGQGFPDEYILEMATMLDHVVEKIEIDHKKAEQLRKMELRHRDERP